MNSIFADNKMLNQEEIRQGKLSIDSKPTSLVVTLTTRCNISCLMCEEIQIPWDMPRQVIDEIVGLFPYLEHILWQGGETLLLNYFTDHLLVEARKHPQLHQTIVTNGLPINRELAEKLVSDNMELTFSIDGVTKASYEKIRRGGDFDRLRQNIKLVNEVRKARGCRNMMLRMHTIIMHSSYKELEDFVDFAKEYGFDALHLMPVWGNIEGKENIFHHQDDEALRYLKEHIAAAETKARAYGLNLLNSLPFSSCRDKECGEAGHENKGNAPEGKLLCHMPWKRLVINPAGNVCPACHCRVMVGNVLDNRLSEIWNNDKMALYRDAIVRRRYDGVCNKDCVNGFIAEELRGLR